MATILKQIRNWFAGESRRAELEQIDRPELSRIARDVGVSVGELGELARLGPDAADLLPRRMQAIGLDVEGIARKEPATMRDMQRLCAQCEQHGRCQHDLVSDPKNPDWQSYCPNVATLRALQ
jgi:hypothetical protein